MKKNKTLFGIAAAMLVMTTTAATAAACTGVYVGKNVSEDGSIMICRTEDMSSSGSKRFIVHQSGEHKAGTSYTDAYGLTVSYDKDSYRYSAVPGSAFRGIGDAPYGGAGFNELGVAVTATITAYPNEQAAAADPYIESGLHELSAADIILSQAESARDGIETAAEYVDKYGCGEGSIIMTADNNEAWYMEIYTGHQYAAVKLPDDKAAVIANAFMLGEIDINSKDVIVSDGIESMPTNNGFIKKTNGKINLRETYSEPTKLSNSLRLWGGRRLLHGTVSEKPDDVSYELLYTPSQKISLKEVMELTRYRYEDTEYSVDKEENKLLRTIGTARQEECHILQLRPSLAPAEGCIEWLCMSNAEFAPYIPYYAAALTDTMDVSKADFMTYSPRSVYWVNRSLNTICALNRRDFGSGVRDFYREYQDKLIEYIDSSDLRMRVSVTKEDTANDICRQLTNDAYYKASTLYSELMTYAAEYEGKLELGETPEAFKSEIKTDIENR